MHGIDVGYNFKISNGGDFTSLYVSSVAFMEILYLLPRDKSKAFSSPLRWSHDFIKKTSTSRVAKCHILHMNTFSVSYVDQNSAQVFLYETRYIKCIQIGDDNGNQWHII